MPGLGVVVHRGRRTGSVYQAPVNVFAAEDGYDLALTYGPDTDWVWLHPTYLKLRARSHRR
jgi:hypothetical protein